MYNIIHKYIYVYTFLYQTTHSIWEHIRHTCICIGQMIYVLNIYKWTSGKNFSDDNQPTMRLIAAHM